MKTNPVLRRSSLLIVLFIAWGHGLPAAETTSGETIVEVEDVVVEFSRQVDVPARRSGSVARVLIRQNDLIAAGDLLLQLDSSEMQLRRRAAMLRQEAAKLLLDDDVELKYAQTALAEAEAELAASQSTHDRFSGAVALNQLRRLRLGVERGQLEVARVEKQKRGAEIDRQLRDADVALIDHELRGLDATSPIDGVVIGVHRDVGEWVAAGESIATIGSAGQLRLRALVDADRIHPATCRDIPVSVYWGPDGSGGSLRGKIVSADPIRLPGNRYRIHAEVMNRHVISSMSSESSQPAWQLVPGMEVSMRIHVPARLSVSSRNDRGYPRGTNR